MNKILATRLFGEIKKIGIRNFQNRSKMDQYPGHVELYNLYVDMSLFLYREMIGAWPRICMIHTV